MEFEIQAQSSDVVFRPAVVEFVGFEHYKAQAEQIAEYVRGIDVTEENLQAVKKDLAAVRKLTGELDRRRIGIKKEILAGYTDFEKEVKEIIAIIDSADEEIRSKTRELDEQEREAKKQKIHELWNKRAGMYQISDVFPDAFLLWLTPQHLNKSVSMKSVEADMVDWLEKTEKEINALKSMDDEYMVEYFSCLDMAKAVEAVNARREIADRIAEAADEDEPEEESAIFIITGKKNITLTEMLLKENEIEYRRK